MNMYDPGVNAEAAEAPVVNADGGDNAPPPVDVPADGGASDEA